MKKPIIINGYEIVKIEIEKYTYTNGLAITFMCKEDDILEPFATITTCLGDILMPNVAYVDTNNSSWVKDVLKKHKLAEPLGRTKTSGWCTYPLYEFNLQAIEEYNESQKGKI